MSKFVHLHVHSHYSLLDGANRFEDLIRTAQRFEMDALGLTDHGNLFGAIEFYTTATAAGIKPILGIEAFISPTTRFDKSMRNINTASYHLILLAMNEVGWRNLIKLSSRAYLEGFYYRPRMDRELLAELNEGLICTTACLGGEVPTALLNGETERAREIAGQYRDIFGPERFFIEIQNQQLPDQLRINPQLATLADELGVGLVGTNDVHFLNREDKPAHEILTCISTGKTLADGGALEYSPQLYLKSPDEMREALREYPRAFDNTVRIAEMCDLKLDFSAKHLPVFQTPEGQSASEYLRQLAFEGLDHHLGGAPPEHYTQRLERELEVIAGKQYCSYVLIVHDFVRYAAENNIPCGARGSGCATLLGYSLGISNIDPVRYGLLFERFTDPQRDEDPDFDIDICQEGRQRIIQYVREKYGHVAQIITYGTLKARAALRDVGRVMDIPLAEVDAIAKKVPEALGITLEAALVGEPDLRKQYEADQRVKDLFDNAMKLEGLSRHAGIHAAAVVFADQPLEDIVPLYKQPDSDDAITQWDGPTCDKIGLMKVDFLGLRTLTTIQRARELVRERTGEDIDPESIPLDDPQVFELFCKGETDGVFQFESGGMKGVLSQMRPNRIEDLIAANAMYRPGPMQLIGTYCKRKNGSESVPGIHPLVDDILSATYGIMIYQEQIMQVLNRLGRLPLNRALTLIKAISKKKEKEIASERDNFLQGAKENGIDHQEGDELFELILKFAGYGFNKAHSTRYAIVAYQTAYFKAHYPREFLAALLTFESQDTDKLAQYIAEAQRMGVPVAPPDINTCDRDFTIDSQQVRFGLAGVKGVGAKAVDAIVRARKEAERFTDLYHFCEYVDQRAVNRATIEALIKCGAFDSLGAHRAAMIAALDDAIELGQAAVLNRRSGQMSFFDTAALSADDHHGGPRFPDVEPWSESQLLTAEKETLGFYITSHPLTRYARELTFLSQPPGKSLAQYGDFSGPTGVTIGCMISSVRLRVTKSGRSAGKKMAILTVEDLTAKCDAVVFAETYEKVSEMLQAENIVFLTGTVDFRRDLPNIIVDEVTPIDRAIETMTGKVVVRVPASEQTGQLLRELGELLSKHHGDCVLLLELHAATRPDILTQIRTDKQWFVRPTRGLIDTLIELLGEEKLVLKPRVNGPKGSNNSTRRFSSRRGVQYAQT